MSDMTAARIHKEEPHLIPVKTPVHLEWLRRQRNRPLLMKYFRQTRPITKSQQKQWRKNLNRKNARLFIVAAGGRWIGYVGFNPIDWRHKHAEFGIFILPEFQGGGHGKAAMRLLLEYGFVKLKLHKIYSDVIDYPNERRFEFYRKLGFKKEGRNKEHYRKGGRWFDSIPFSMFKSKSKK